MIRVLFVCHGNICRSPMAEYMFKDLVEKKGVSKLFYIESKATSREEIGNDIYPPAKKILNLHNIKYDKHYARQIVESDIDNFDYIIVMDSYNVYNAKRILGNKDIKMLLEYTGNKRDVSDPWYTRDFETCYNDILEGLNAFYNYLDSNGIIK